MKLLNSKISFFIIGYEISLEKKIIYIIIYKKKNKDTDLKKKEK